MRWEYCVVWKATRDVMKIQWMASSGETNKDSLDLINELGTKGWEMVGVEPVTPGSGPLAAPTFWFKRPA